MSWWKWWWKSCFRWKLLGIITSTQPLWRDTAVRTKDILERRGVKVIFRSIEPIFDGTKVSMYKWNKFGQNWHSLYSMIVNLILVWNLYILLYVPYVFVSLCYSTFIFLNIWLMHDACISCRSTCFLILVHKMYFDPWAQKLESFYFFCMDPMPELCSFLHLMMICWEVQLTSKYTNVYWQNCTPSEGNILFDSFNYNFKSSFTALLNTLKWVPGATGCVVTTEIGMKLQKVRVGQLTLFAAILFLVKCFFSLWNRILYLYSEYSYISIGKERDSYQSIPNYRPEIGDSIWNGLISIDPFFPLGDGWQDFAKRIIAGAQHPMWQPYPHLPSSAPISSVTPTSGMTWRVLRINGYLLSRTPIYHILGKLFLVTKLIGIVNHCINKL